MCDLLDGLEIKRCIKGFEGPLHQLPILSLSACRTMASLYTVHDKCITTFVSYNRICHKWQYEIIVDSSFVVVSKFVFFFILPIVIVLILRSSLVDVF